MPQRIHRCGAHHKGQGPRCHNEGSAGQPLSTCPRQAGWRQASRHLAHDKRYMPVLSKKSPALRSANTESVTRELEAKMNTDPTRARVLITGCGGMLGEAVQRVFTQRCPDVLATDIDLNETWLTHSDVRDIAEC